jgi:hypothetical protein
MMGSGHFLCEEAQYALQKGPMIPDSPPNWRNDGPSLLPKIRDSSKYWFWLLSGQFAYQSPSAVGFTGSDLVWFCSDWEGNLREFKYMFLLDQRDNVPDFISETRILHSSTFITHQTQQTKHISLLGNPFFHPDQYWDC